MSRFLSAFVPKGLDATAHQYINKRGAAKDISTLNTTFKKHFKVGFASRTTKCSHNLVPDFFCQFVSFIMSSIKINT